MGTRYPVARTARRITYKIQTHDVRQYLLQDIVERARHAVILAGGRLLGGVFAPPKHIKRWCVLRSPHVNKKSREHFWMVTHRRIFKWDAPPTVDRDAPHLITSLLPPSVATRTCLEVPGLMALRDVFDTLHTAQQQPPSQNQSNETSADPAAGGEEEKVTTQEQGTNSSTIQI